MPTKAELEADLAECQKACKGHVKLLNQYEADLNSAEERITQLALEHDSVQPMADIVNALTMRAHRAEARAATLIEKFTQWQQGDAYTKEDYMNLTTAMALDMTAEFEARAK